MAIELIKRLHIGLRAAVDIFSNGDVTIIGNYVLNQDRIALTPREADNLAMALPLSGGLVRAGWRAVALLNASGFGNEEEVRELRALLTKAEVALREVREHGNG